MNLCRRVSMRRLNEVYQGKNAQYRGQTIRTTYFEREYLPGVATDKLTADRYARPDYSQRFATILGRAAASSLVVGRVLESPVGKRPVFDDGDELVREGEDGLPLEIHIGDHTGAFAEYKQPLETFAAVYARPINTRDRLVPEPLAFARAYLEALGQQLHHIQDDYRKRRRAFDRMFGHCKYDTAGSFAYRWECVLRRLDQTDVDHLVAEIRRHIRVLNVGVSPTVERESVRA
jgi:hypothetical protein